MSADQHTKQITPHNVRSALEAFFVWNGQADEVTVIQTATGVELHFEACKVNAMALSYRVEDLLLHLFGVGTQTQTLVAKRPRIVETEHGYTIGSVVVGVWNFAS